MVLMSPNHSKSYKVRSISFPARSGQVQDTITVAEDVEKLQSWLASSPPHTETVCTGLECLNQLYICIKQLLVTNSSQALQALSNSYYEKWVTEMIEESMVYVDICSAARDATCQMRECISEFQSALRRKKGNEIDIEKNFEGYMRLRKNMKKAMEKSLLELKHMENKFAHISNNKALNTHLLDMVRVLKDTSFATNLMLQKVLLYLSIPIVKAKASRWSLAKLITKGPEECIKNEFENVDIEVMNLPIHSSTQISEDDQSLNTALQKLDSLDLSLKAYENGLEGLFKNLVHMRVTYLNICSQ